MHVRISYKHDCNTVYTTATAATAAAAADASTTIPTIFFTEDTNFKVCVNGMG